MTNKEKIQNLVDRMPDNITLDQAVYRMELLRKIEIGLQQMKEGKVTDHDEVFAELLGNEKKGQSRVVGSGESRPRRAPRKHSKAQSHNGGQVRRTAKKVSR